MITTRLSSKGQVVIPKHMRDKLGLEAGAVLSVGVDNDAIVLHRGKALRLPTEDEVNTVAACLKVGGPMPTPAQEEAALSAFFRATHSDTLI